MIAAHLPPMAIETFRRYYERLVAGATGLQSSREIGPVDELPHFEALENFRDSGIAALERTVVIKLNGGLGTSMGMTRAKSLLPVKPGQTFLDIIARQVLALRAKHGSRLPLVLMNSFRTREDSLAALARYPELATELPLDFLQHRVPRILVDGLTPAVWPRQPEYEWCPPGHGDIYTALLTSGMLAKLLEQKFQYAFVSNADNLGAVLDPSLLGWVTETGIPFLMEVADRTEADKKGGHLARRRHGGLTLRESAQCPPDEVASFQDTDLFRYFNTNNLWVDLQYLESVLRERDGILELPMIRNEKRLDPADDTSPRVLQLETAMGSAISVFEGARAVRVPRTRFAPVKTTSDLLRVWSDAYVLTDDYRIVPATGCGRDAPALDLDPAYYGRIDQLEERFSKGAPSLVACRRLVVRGDVRFGAHVVCLGDVELHNPGAAPLMVADGTTLRG